MFGESSSYGVIGSCSKSVQSVSVFSQKLISPIEVVKKRTMRMELQLIGWDNCRRYGKDCGKGSESRPARMVDLRNYEPHDTNGPDRSTVAQIWKQIMCKAHGYLYT